MIGSVSSASSSYSDIVSAMNDVTERWSNASSRNDAVYRTPEARSRPDPELKAVNDYLSGVVPEKGSNVVELVAKFVV